MAVQLIKTHNFLKFRGLEEFKNHRNLLNFLHAHHTHPYMHHTFIIHTHHSSMPYTHLISMPHILYISYHIRTCIHTLRTSMHAYILPCNHACIHMYTQCMHISMRPCIHPSTHTFIIQTYIHLCPYPFYFTEWKSKEI